MPGRQQAAAPASGPPLWLYQTEPGLGALLAQELRFVGAVARKAQFARLHLRNHDLLVLPESAVRKRDAAPRLATNIMVAPVFGRGQIGKNGLDLLARSMQNEKADGIAVEIAGESFSRTDLLTRLRRELGSRGMRLAPDPRRPVLFAAIDEKFYFGFPRFNHHQVKGRSAPSEREGSLPAVIAAAMVFAAKPAANEVIWDPVMGTGTVLVEAGAMAPGAQLVGSDIDGEAVALARRRLAGSKGAQLSQGDAARADLGADRLTLTIGNLPFGKKFQPREGNRALYETILRRSLAEAGASWRASLLTSDSQSLLLAVEAIGGLSLDEAARISVRGTSASIWLVRRT